MTCRKFFFAAVLAVAGAVIAPAMSQAAFSVKFDLYDASNVVVGSVTVNDNGAGDMSGTAGKIALVDAPAVFTANGIGLDTFTSTSNAPGIPTALLTDTSVSLTKLAGSNVAKIVITTSETQFATGSAGNKMTLSTRADANNDAGLAGVTGNVQTTVTDGATYSDGPLTLPTGIATSNSSSPTTFTRSGNAFFTLTQVITLNFAGATGEADFATSSTVVAPAPSGLILLAGAVPFVGLLRRWRKKPAAEGETAPVAA